MQVCQIFFRETIQKISCILYLLSNYCLTVSTQQFSWSWQIHNPLTIEVTKLPRHNQFSQNCPWSRHIHLPWMNSPHISVDKSKTWKPEIPFSPHTIHIDIINPADLIFIKNFEYPLQTCFHVIHLNFLINYWHRKRLFSTKQFNISYIVGISWLK